MRTIERTTMADDLKVLKRAREVAARAREANSFAGRCRVLGCTKPARAAAGEGLDRRLCTAHADFYQRHGSPYKRSYSATEIAPHRLAAAAWLKANEHHPIVVNALQRVRHLYDSAGPHREAFRLTGLSPTDRARAAWARLRKTGINPRKVVIAWIAVELTIRADPQAVRTREFKRVQAAKLIHRLASGSHRTWNAPFGPKELHVYPQSRGQVLRHIGAAAEEALELISEEAVGALHKPSISGARLFD